MNDKLYQKVSQSYILTNFNLRYTIISNIYRVPTRTGRTGKPGKMGKHFPVREKSGNFEQTGKVRENHTKYWKTEKISEKNYLFFFKYI